MKQPLQITAVLVGLLVLGGGALLLWANSGPRSKAELAQQKTYSASPASADRDTFTVMTYDLGHLAGPEPSAPTPDRLFSVHMSETIDLIQQADPDVIGFQSVDFGAARSGNVHQLDTIATRLDFAAAGQAIGWNDRYLPAAQTGPVVSGQAILSRFPLRRHVRRELAPSSSPFWSDWFSPQSLMQVTAVDIGGWPLIVMNVHLRAPDVSVREEQARLVNQFYSRLARRGFPIVLLGSFNSVMPAVPPTPSKDDTMELLLRGTDLQPALSAEGARLTGRTVATYPAPDPTRKFDYIFYRPRAITPTNAETLCGSAPRPEDASASTTTVDVPQPRQDSVPDASESVPPSDHCAVTMSFLLPRPKDQLPETRIPSEDLPSLDSLVRR